MKCRYCEQEATVHLTDIVNKKQRQMHLCESCAREKKVLPDSSNDLNVPALLELVFGSVVGATKPTSPDDVSCAECGTPYAHFRTHGRLGCPHDYEAFRTLLEPLLERVHNNQKRHGGKVPSRYRRRVARARRTELQEQLRSAIHAERYEDAARIRDELKGLGADDAD